jgi:ABC-type nitrate/sulfonate/bicarbonate transport system permease component
VTERGAQVRIGAIQLAFVVVVFGIWQGLTQAHAVNPLFLPALPAVAASLARLVASAGFWSAVGVTALTVAEAYVLAVAAGIAAGFFIGRSAKLTAAFEPLLSGIFAVPIALFFPLFVVLFGIGPGSKVAFGAVYGFFPIALNTIAGFGGVDALLLRAARSQGATKLQTFRHVYLPGALPVVVGGLRIGFFICFASVLGGETLSSAAGVGHAIAHEGELLESAPMFAWIVLVVAATLALNLGVSALESRAGR